MQGKMLKRSMFVGALIASALSANAMPVSKTGESIAPVQAETLIPVAQGCGPGGWRGPMGGCRYSPYWGPLPRGGWVEPPAWRYFGTGCPPGYWRGPWGHCRDTPYHGRLPGGGWK